MIGRGSFANTSDNPHPKPKHRAELPKDSRLQYVLAILNVTDLYDLFISNNIGFVDMLLLEKSDMIELQLELYQRNRVWNFSVYYKKYAKSYSIEEIDNFFSFNRQFIFLQSNPDESNENDKEGEEGSCSVNEGDSRCKLYSQTSDIAQDNIPSKPKKIFSQKPVNPERSLAKKTITLSTSKENVHEEIVEERKAFETYPNIHQSVLDEYPMNSTNSPQYNYTSTIPNKRSHRDNTSAKEKKAITVSNAFRNYLNLQQNSDDVLLRLTKLKEEGETKRSKYKALMQKVEKTQPLVTVKPRSDAKDFHFKKMMIRIDQASEMKMSLNAFEQLNQIKEFINIKGKHIKLSDIQLVNKELDVLFASLQAENSLQSNNEEENDNEPEGNVNEVEEVEEEYEADDGE